MRKLNHRRPKAVPIPRPPTPPHSVQVQTIKQLLFAKNSEHSAGQSLSDSASWTSEASSTRLMSSSSTVENEPADAIEPNAEFPPPPADFLEDIRAFRKLQDIDDPLPSPILHPDARAHNHVFRFPHHLECGVRNDSSFSGNGSLNSSITETTESSCSPSVSPTASPLPSPTHSSVESASTTSYSMHDMTSRVGNSHFVFPPSKHMCHSMGQAVGHRKVTGSRLVTLAPLHPPSSFDKEPIYQRIPAGYGTLPRSGATSALIRPPDYLTAMQRLSLSRTVQPVGSKTTTVTHIVRPMPPLKAMSHSGLTSIPSSNRSIHTTSTIRLPTGSSHNRRSSISCGELQALGQTEKAVGLNSRTMKGTKVKKRVSFSDQVELVAHSEDMSPDQHLPNPLLERVLGKAFLQSQNIHNS